MAKSLAHKKLWECIYTDSDSRWASGTVTTKAEFEIIRANRWLSDLSNETEEELSMYCLFFALYFGDEWGERSDPVEGWKKERLNYIFI